MFFNPCCDQNYFLSFFPAYNQCYFWYSRMQSSIITINIKPQNSFNWYVYYCCVVVLCWSFTFHLTTEYCLTIIHFTVIQECAIYRGLLRQSMSLYFPLRPQDKIFKERWIFTLQGNIFLSRVLIHWIHYNAASLLYYCHGNLYRLVNENQFCDIDLSLKHFNIMLLIFKNIIVG